MITRVQTARQEMLHIGEFDYGELSLLRSTVSFFHMDAQSSSNAAGCVFIFTIESMHAHCHAVLLHHGPKSSPT